MLGMHGTVAANFAVDRADLLLAIGVRFDDRVTGKLESFAARARIVHVDIDPAEINKNKASHVTVCADAKPSLKVGTLALPWLKLRHVLEMPGLLPPREQFTIGRLRHPVRLPNMGEAQKHLVHPSQDLLNEGKQVIVSVSYISSIINLHSLDVFGDVFLYLRM